MDSGYYPPGAEFDTKAPYNQEDPSEKEVEVTVSVTLSKTLKIKVYDIPDPNLHEAVEEQIVLPQNLAMFTESVFNHDLNLKASGMPLYLKDAIADCKDWNTDDFEVILEY